MSIRLNKVTRDLNVGIQTVAAFLRKKGFEIELSPNAKITDEQYQMLVKEFSSDKNLKIESERISQERQKEKKGRPGRDRQRVSGNKDIYRRIFETTHQSGRKNRLGQSE